MDKKLSPGEKGFPFLLLLLGIYVTFESVKMYRDAPELQGYGTVPLICGILLIVLSLFIILNNFRFESEIKGQPVKAQASAVVKYLCSKDVIVMIGFIVAYCIVLNLGVPFVIVSPVFLWGSMTYLSKGGYLKNILFTAIVMAFIILVFNVGFQVVFP